MKKKRAVVYARVSTKSTEQEQSLDIQMESIEKYCQEAGFEHIETYKEHGRTGTSLRKRPAFVQMMHDAGLDFDKNTAGIDHFKVIDREPSFDVIFVKDIFRFGRNTQQGLAAIEQLTRKNIEVVFLNMKLSTFDKNAETVLPIFLSMSQSEAQANSDKIKYSKRSLSKKGVYRPSKLPFGYIKEYSDDKDYKVVINPEEIDIVKEIFHLYLNENIGGARIAKLLNEKDAKAPGKKRGWTNDKVYKILKDTVYYGSPTLHRRTKKKVTEHYYSKADPSTHIQVHDAVEPIISKEEFELVQELIQSRTDEQQNRGKNFSKDKLYSNKLKCLTCGGSYASNFTKKYRNYICVNHKKYGKTVCENGGTVRESQISKYVMASDLVIDELQRKISFNKLTEGIKKANSTIGKLIESKKHEIAELQENIKITLKANKTEKDEFFKEQYRLEVEQDRERISTLEDELVELNSNLIDKFKQKVEIKHQFLAELKNRKPELFTLEERIELIKKIKVNSNEIVIEYETPNFNDEINEFNNIFDETGLHIDTQNAITNIYHYKRNKGNIVVPIEAYYDSEIRV